MGRILAIDYGKKRTGLAVTDPQQIIASPLTTLETPKLLAFIEKYVIQESVEKIVVGMPETTNNIPTHSTADILKLVNQLKKKFPALDIETVDENYTSKQAVQALVQMGASKKQRRQKENIDKIAATIILQRYLGIENNY